MEDDLISIVYKKARELGGVEALKEIQEVYKTFPSCKQYMGNNNPLYHHCMENKWNYILEHIIEKYKNGK